MAEVVSVVSCLGGHGFANGDIQAGFDVARTGVASMYGSLLDKGMGSCC